MLEHASIDWPRPVFEFVEFVAAFLAAGALGFRFAVIGRVRREAGADDARVHAAALRRAAWIGLLGGLYGTYHVASGLPGIASRQSMSIAAVLVGFTPAAVRLWMSVVTLGGFAVAALSRSWGWPLAAAGIVVGMGRPVLFGHWAQAVKPLHLLAGGLWIGTLFVLVVAGISTVLRSDLAPEHRGRMIARMVGAFSPLALIVAGILGICGVILMRRELQPFSSLWTTPYGSALLAKLCVVAVVVVIGWWNWRRQKPRLGTEVAGLSLRRSATAELAVAGLVVAITAVLVSLPAPGSK